MNKQIELNREYWGRVIDMCQGTALKGREWECVKRDNEVWSNMFRCHPCFDDYSVDYELAVAVVEDKAVFKYDKLFNIDDGYEYPWLTRPNKDWDNWTWQKPELKRTFLLNGVELPCPVKRHEGDWYVQINGKTYWFELEDEANKVQNAISNILDLARDKQ